MTAVLEKDFPFLSKLKLKRRLLAPEGLHFCDGSCWRFNEQFMILFLQVQFLIVEDITYKVVTSSKKGRTIKLEVV